MQRHGSRRVLLLACLAVMGGCLETLLPHYTGDLPDRAPLANERVVVRQTVPSSVLPGAIGAFYGDRIAFVTAGDPHDVNRVVHIATGSLTQRVAELGVRIGDTLVVTTRYDTTYYEAVASGAVPDWPGHGHAEYPIAQHTLTAVSRNR